MRAYSASDEESVRARVLLKDWTGEGFLTEAQYQLTQQETVCELRRTSIFLRIVLFLFTLIIVGAAVALFIFVFLPVPGWQADGISLLIFAALSYAAAEFSVSGFSLYRYGIEEGLAACSVGLLCAGLEAASMPAGAEFLVPAAGAIGSLWIWHRFGLVYAFPAALIFVAWMATDWSASHTARHMIIAAIYAIGLLTVAAIRPRYRFTYLNDSYSIAEALLWLGIYLTINLQLSSPSLFAQWWVGTRAATGFSRPFYWTTWVMIWCLPPIVLARGVRRKDQFVIAMGVIVTMLTLITNKSYLGWPRHTWDLMLLGALLIGVALFVRRWLAHGPGEIRHGFTARRLSGKDKRWMNAGVTALGVVSPNIITPSPQTGDPDVHFGGGGSGGGGASSDF